MSELRFSPDGERLLVLREGSAWIQIVGDPGAPVAPRDAASVSLVTWSGDVLVLRASGGLRGFDLSSGARWSHPVDDEAALSVSADGRFVAVVTTSVRILRLADRNEVTLVAQRDDGGKLVGRTYPPHGAAEMTVFMRGAP